MSRFDNLLNRGTSVARLLAEAGMEPSKISTDRSFASNWGWDDGETAYATIWIDDIREVDGLVHWHVSDPRMRNDLQGQRKARAQALFDILARRVDKPVRVILQTRKPNPATWGSGEVDRRGVDPEMWFATLEGDTVQMQRGMPLASKTVSVDGKPMPSRPPGWTMRETRPEQA